MILQPLVENSVTHGVGAMIRGGRVTVRLLPASGRSRREVEDNGAGIPEKKLEKLRASFDEDGDDGGHIGLRNVYQRLKLFFGDELLFEIEGAHGRTVVRIGLPRALDCGEIRKGEPL